MSNVVAVRQVFIYARIHCDTFENGELLKEEILAPSYEMMTWAQEELSNTGLEALILDDLDKDKGEDGIYSAIALYSLSGGRDADTPNGPGEYWSEMTRIGDIHICRLSRDQAEAVAKESGVVFEEGDLDLLYPPKTQIILHLPWG